MSDSEKSVKKTNLFSLFSKENLLVHNEDGSIDWEVTLVGIQNQVEEEAARVAELDTQILAALNGVFDKLKSGQRIPEPMAVNLAIREMAPDATVEEMQVLTNCISDFLDRTNLFEGKRGRNGGLGRA